MTRKPHPKPDDPEQSKRFIEAAREAEADESEAGADRAFKKVVSSPQANTRSREKSAKP
jgi:hypothetical protein